MAESWVRLWSDMTTDPKWQTIARKSGQPRSLVIAVFTHLMLEANAADDRGSVLDVNIEDVASAMDCDESAVAAILEAMEGRVIDDGRLAGWERRQPRREDSGNESSGAMSSTERSKKYREKQRSATQRDANATNATATQRSATQRDAPEAEADTETEEKNLSPKPSPENSDTGDPGKTAESDSPASPYGLLCKVLRHAGVQVQPGNPDFRSWVDAGLTEAEALAAVDIARVTKPAPESIAWAYLAKVLETQRQRAKAAKPAAGATASSDPMAWAATWSGIVAKGTELGLEQQPGEIAPDFRARVHAAAGITTADKSRLLADYGVRA